MKLLLIGHSVEDHIIKNAKEVIQPGGLYYTALAVSSIKAAEDEMFLHTSLKNNYHLFDDVYSGFNKKYVEELDEVPEIHLTIHPDKEREERYTNITTKLNLPQQYDFGFDGILINMITGFEIEPEELKVLRNNFGGLIYFDLHSLSRGMNEKLERIFRPVPNKVKWLRCIDILQTNENEIFTLSDKKNINAIASEVLESGVKILIITKGELGVRAYVKNGSEIESVFVSAEKLVVKNKVGCGDIFGAVFFYNYIKDANLLDALLKANRAAGIAVSYDEFFMFKNLKNDVSRRFN